MNTDTLAGKGTGLKGRFKESVGNATGDTALQHDGLADQIAGNVRKGFGSLRDFARNQPLAAAAAAGVVAIALLGSLRGRKSG